MPNSSPDLTQNPPRSPRVRLGGYAILPRMLDKGQRLLQFLGLDADALKQQLAADKGDGEILDWILANGKNKHTDAEILAWSLHQEQRVPTDPDTRNYFNELHAKAAPHREDIATWFDLLDLDDYVSFGGKA
jgi:hypothetical protein